MTGKTEQNFTKLIKLLRMTTSPNDAEALVAMRKANEALAAFGTDWETLLTGRVTIVADPFNSIPTPPQKPDVRPPTRPNPPSPPQPTPPPPPSSPIRPSYASSSRSKSQPKPQPQPRVDIRTYAAQNNLNLNRFDGNCRICNTRLKAGSGLLSRHLGGTPKVFCQPCYEKNTAPMKVAPKVDLSDIF